MGGPREYTAAALLEAAKERPFLGAGTLCPTEHTDEVPPVRELILVKRGLTLNRLENIQRIRRVRAWMFWGEGAAGVSV